MTPIHPPPLKSGGRRRQLLDSATRVLGIWNNGGGAMENSTWSYYLGGVESYPQLSGYHMLGEYGGYVQKTQTGMSEICRKVSEEMAVEWDHPQEWRIRTSAIGFDHCGNYHMVYAERLGGFTSGLVFKTRGIIA